MVSVGDLLDPAHQTLGAEAAQRAAMEYIRRGWAVTAGPGLDADGVCACRARKKCRNPGKHAYKGWGNEERRTLSEGQAERYWSPTNGIWQEKPVDQVFIVPYLSGLIVADVDNMESWSHISDRPETLSQKSGSGRGGHYLYKFDWDTSDPIPPLVAGKLPHGAGEVKFRGIIAAAPSVHKSGGRYEWENWGTEIADAPEWLTQPPVNASVMTTDWDTLMASDTSDRWVTMMFAADLGGLDSVGNARSSRPLVMFAAAAAMAKWITLGMITEDEVVDRLLAACEKNAAMDTYGSTELTRQIKNGIRAGMVEKR